MKKEQKRINKEEAIKKLKYIKFCNNIEELEDDIIEQIFINSKICSEKMKNYNKVRGGEAPPLCVRC